MMRMLFSVLMLSLAAALGAQGQDRPNVLFIAIDDLRPELGCYGSEVAITPSIDQLAAGGMVFERAYCNIAVCGASRASLLSGMLPIPGERFRNYKTRLDEDVPGVTTLPQLFKDAGYTTLSNGKVFHHASDTQARSWSEPAWRPRTSSLDMLLPETRAQLSDKGRGYIFEAADVEDEAYGDGQVAAKTIADLRRLKDAGEPFFLACGFTRPHMPFYAPKKYWDLYDPETLPLAENRFTPRGAPDLLKSSTEYDGYFLGDLEINSDRWHREMLHGYLASTSYADAMVGKVLDELEALGLADNTIVVLWGDHGWHLGEHNFWSKHNTLHLAARIPLIVRVPEPLAPDTARGGRTAALVESVDIFPTLTELADLALPQTVQGRSFTALFAEPDAAFRAYAYCRHGAGDTVFTEHFAYTRYRDADGPKMLFDHRTDPDENQNVADDPAYAQQVRELDALLNERMDEAKGETAGGE